MTYSITQFFHSYSSYSLSLYIKSSDLFPPVSSMASLSGSASSASFFYAKPNQATASMDSVKAVSFSVNGKSSSSLNLRAAPSRLRISCAAKPETVDKVCKIVRQQLALPADSEINGESKFAALGADSLDTVEIVMGLEEEFGITVEEENAQTTATVQDAADLIEKLQEKN